MVKFLSCVVVFCTTYALVLPAITEEAKAYCHVPEHHHTLECYQTIQTCSQHEHTHDDFCSDENGNLICTQAEHSHDDSCYEKQLDCDQIEHTHSLICFSNPDADLETIQDWKQDTKEALFQDDEQEERSTRETITAIAAHQIGNKASHDNYQVADDGKTRIGITRYGQWDDDPYQENWSSSFVRYVLHFAQADEATKDAPKDLYDWMSQLSDSQQLLTIDNAEAGDVLFVLDQKDATIAKAAIIEQEDENELVAIGQDAKDEVARQTYNRDDPLLHSIYKPVETSKGAFEENTPEDKKSVSKSPAADEEADNSKTPYNQNANPKSSDDEIKDNELALFDSSQKDSEFEDEKPDAFLKNNEKFDMKQNDTDDDNDAETNNSEKEQNQKTLDEKTSDAAKPSTSSPSGKDSNHLQTSTSKSDDLTNPKKNDANQSSTSSKSSLNNTTPSGSDQKDSKNSEESKTSQKDKDESSKEADSRNTNSQATNQTNHSDQHQADDGDLTARKQIIDIQTVQKDSEQTKAQAIADDGTIVQAKWNPGTFEEETVVFQAKVKQTEPDVEKQVLESLQAEDADQYQAITYDLTFYRRGENAELEEIEPNGTILVTFGFTQDIKHVDSIYHYPASKRLEKMNLEQVNNSADQKEANEAKQTQNRIPESPKAKQSSSNVLTSLDKEDNAQDSTNSNDNAGQASETSKDQDSNLELNQDSKPESNKPSSGSKPDSDKDSDSKSTNPPASLGEGKPGENSNSESKSGSEQNIDIDPTDTEESEPNQTADSAKGSQTNPDQTSSVKSTAEQADQTVPNPTDSSSVSIKAANEIRTSITAALKQSLQTKSVQTNSQVEDESENKDTDINKNSTVKSSSSSDDIESDNILDSSSNNPSSPTGNSNIAVISEPTVTESSFESELTDLTSNPSIQIVQFETDSFSQYVAVVKKGPQSDEIEIKYDYSQQIQTEDGATVRVSWNKGTFETENVVFSARKVELTEQEEQKIQEYLDKDQTYTLKNYDLSFYVYVENDELQEVEPKQDVYVEILFEGQISEKDQELPVFHLQDNGEIEVLNRSKKQTSSNDAVTFEASHFSVYSVPVAEEGIDAQYYDQGEWTFVYKATDLQSAIDNGKKKIKLANNISERYGYSINGKSDLIIDLNGNNIQSGYTVFSITNSSTVNFMNSGISGGVIGFNDQGREKDSVGRIIAVSGSTLSLQNVTIDGNKEGTGGGSGGILADNSTVAIDGGGIKNCDSRIDTYNEDHFYGGGLYARNGSTVILGPNPPTIENNIANEGGGIAIGKNQNGNDKSILIIDDAIIRNNSTNEYKRLDNTDATFSREGGGIALVADSNSSAIINKATIQGNQANKTDGQGTWGGGGIFAAQGTYLWLPNGASIYGNISDSLGGGLTACSTGKIYIDSKMHIFGNFANANGTYSNGNKLNDAQYEENWYNGGHRGESGYKGEDIFSNMEAEITGAYSNGTPSNWTGVIDGTVYQNSKDGFLVTKNKWMILKANPSNTDSLKNQDVIITENGSRTHGAGVLVNGYLVSGDYTHNYIGDYLNLKGTKAYYDETGKAKSQYDDQFKFGIYDSDGVLAAQGTSDSNGNITFPRSLYLSFQPTGTGDNRIFEYTLREIADELPGSISADLKAYNLEITVSTTASNTYVKPVWDASRQCYESKSVTVYRQYITKVRYKLEDQDRWTEKIFSAQSSTKTVTVPESGNSFENRDTPVQDVVVNKVWSGEDAPVNSIQVQLQYRSKDSTGSYTDYKKPVELSTENEWSHRWNDVPSQDSNGNPLEYNIKEINAPEGWQSSLSNPVTLTETVTDPNTTVTKEVWVPATEIQDGVTYKMISLDARKVLQVNSGNTSTHPTVSDNSGSIEESLILEDEHGNKVIDKTFNAGINIVSSTEEANPGKITALNNKTGTAIRTDLTSHAWFQTTTSDSRNGLSIEWTDRYCDSSYQGFRINSQGYLEGGINSNYFVNITCSNNRFGTVENGSPVQLFYKAERRIPQQTDRKVTIQTFTLTNFKPKYDLQIKKVDKDDPSKVLQGAVFELYEGTDEATDEATLKKVGDSQTTDANGLTTFAGLEKGTYWIKETKQPEGYVEPDGKYIKVDVPDENVQNPMVVTVKNELLVFELPETGGSGTDLITYSGAALILASGGLYITSRKQRRKQNQ